MLRLHRGHPPHPEVVGPHADACHRAVLDDLGVTGLLPQPELFSPPLPVTCTLLLIGQASGDAPGNGATTALELSPRTPPRGERVPRHSGSLSQSGLKNTKRLAGPKAPVPCGCQAAPRHASSHPSVRRGDIRGKPGHPHRSPRAISVLLCFSPFLTFSQLRVYLRQRKIKAEEGPGEASPCAGPRGREEAVGPVPALPGQRRPC